MPLANELVPDVLRKRAKELEIEIEQLRQRMTEVYNELHATRRAIVIVEEKFADTPDKPLCRNCDHLKVSKIGFLPDGRPKGSGYCHNCGIRNGRYYGKAHPRDFSQIGCSNFKCRERPLEKECGLGGRPIK